MKKYIFTNFKILILLAFVSNFLIACTSTREAVYFYNQPEGVYDNLVPATLQVINSNDILSITVSSLNPEATLIFNNPTSNTGSTGSGSFTQSTGYLIDQEGFIQFPVLGKIKVAGLTKMELTEFLRKTLVDKQLLLDPVVAVRYLNFRITVLGEVTRPMVVAVPNEKISLLEAIGMAGDLTIYARRDNILLIREEKGKRMMKRLNLNSGDIFNSQYYYLKSNDIVYVEPNKSKIFSASNTRVILPIVFSALSVVAIVIDRVTR
jgi:polysaccharide export outer membrane protein